MILAMIVSMIFFLFGYYASDIVPFGTHYDHAEKYQTFLHAAFDGNVRVEIQDQKAVADRRINTYTTDTDRSAYSLYGYDLIVDTRASDTLIRFEQTAVKGDRRISYEDYRQLSDEAKREYSLEVEYSDEEIRITEEMADRYALYLEKISMETDREYDSEASKKYNDLQSVRGQYSEAAYREELYYLYIEYYYSSVGSSFQGARAPVLRDYYYHRYITAGKAHYFYLFDNLCAGSFETDRGIPVVFGGYYHQCSDGEIADTDDFIKSVFYDTAGYTFVSYVVSTLALFSTLAVAPLLIALVMWGIGKWKEGNWEPTFGGCYKTVASFIWFSAFLVSLAVWIGGWFASARALYKLIPMAFTSVLLLRTVLFCIFQIRKHSKTSLMKQSSETSHQFDDVQGENL